MKFPSYPSEGFCPAPEKCQCPPLTHPGKDLALFWHGEDASPIQPADVMHMPTVGEQRMDAEGGEEPFSSHSIRSLLG